MSGGREERGERENVYDCLVMEMLRDSRHSQPATSHQYSHLPQVRNFLFGSLPIVSNRTELYNLDNFLEIENTTK